MGPSVSNPQPVYDLDAHPSPASIDRPRSRPASSWDHRVAWSLAALLGVLHGVAVWIGIGGLAGMLGEWPILSSDHGFHYHHGLMTRHFLRTTGFSAGYDPSFMSGYAMSVISGTSSTLANLVILAFGGDRPAVAFKVMTFACVAVLPWVVLLAGAVLRSSPVANVSLARALSPLFLDRFSRQLRRSRDDRLHAVGSPRPTVDRPADGLPRLRGGGRLARRGDLLRRGVPGPPHQRDGPRARRTRYLCRRASPGPSRGPAVSRLEAPGLLRDRAVHPRRQRVLAPAGLLAGLDGR